MRLEKISLGLVFLIAFFLRFNNLNWDSNYHLHPDERFLTMVNTSQKIPSSFKEYLDPKTSTLNPTNVGHTFYVYGVFPLILNKYIAVQLGTDEYNAIPLQGRALSGLFDLITLIFIYKITKLLYSKKEDSDKRTFIPIWATFFYAISVLPIQLSHFYAVDTFLTAFMITSFYYSLRYYYRGGIEHIAVAAILWGLAMSSKVSALYILPLHVALIGLRFWNEEAQHESYKFFTHIKRFAKKIPLIIMLVFIFILLAYVTVRFANPYYFADSNPLNLKLNKQFLDNIDSLKALQSRDIWFPPSIQWLSKTPVLFSLTNIIFFGLGLPLALLMIAGLGIVVRETVQGYIKDKKWEIPIIFTIMGWVLIFFLYQSLQLAQSLRYFIFLYPLFALFAGIAFYRVSKMGYLWKSIVVILAIIWPLAFSSIYLRPHSRVEATEWIYKNIEPGSTLLYEHWDDILPLNTISHSSGIYSLKELPVFGQDDETKWNMMNERLQEADYYILSSNRGWGSLTTVPEKYPRMSKFYNNLLAGKTQYTLVREFTSYPQLCIFSTKICLVIEDQWSEEAFTVYDHPKVLIFKNTEHAN